MGHGPNGHVAGSGKVQANVQPDTVDGRDGQNMAMDDGRNDVVEAFRYEGNVAAGKEE